MRIHTNDLQAVRTAIHAAANGLPGVYVTLSEHGSRKRAGAVELSLEGTSTRKKNTGQRGASADYAATWDEWGVVLQAAFNADADATSDYYASLEDYQHQTGSRFVGGTVQDTLPDGRLEVRWPGGVVTVVDAGTRIPSAMLPEDTHQDHRWDYRPGQDATPCTRCSAVKRRPLETVSAR